MITEHVKTGIAATVALFGHPPSSYGLSEQDFNSFCGEQNLKPKGGEVQWEGVRVHAHKGNPKAVFQAHTSGARRVRMVKERYGKEELE